jgi:hypothetical protein
VSGNATAGSSLSSLVEFISDREVLELSMVPRQQRVLAAYRQPDGQVAVREDSPSSRGPVNASDQQCRVKSPCFFSLKTKIGEPKVIG